MTGPDQSRCLSRRHPTEPKDPGVSARERPPGSGGVAATELVLRRLLPLARQGLAAWGIDSSVSDRLLGVIERRWTTQVNGAEWQARAFHQIDNEKQPLDRRHALREMLRRYVEHRHSKVPVHPWPLT